MAKKKTDSPVSYRSIMSGGRSLFESNDNDFGYKKDQSPIINTKEYVDSQNSINEYRDRMQKERDARKQAIELAKWEQSNKVHAVTNNNVTLSIDQAINRAKERTANYSEDQIKAADEFNKNTKTGANAVQRRYVLGSMGEKVGLSADEFEQLAEYRRYITGQESADTKAEEAKQKVKDHPFLGAISETIDANLKGYVTAADTTKETLKKYSGAYKDSELPINTYTRGAEDARVSAAVAQQVKENIDNSVSNPILNKAINFGYDLFNSGVTNVANRVVSTAVGAATGIEQVGEAYGYLKFFNSGYQQSVIDSQTKGLDENRAIALGAANGAAEVIGELLSFHYGQKAIKGLLKGNISKNALVKLLLSANFAEGVGEAETDVVSYVSDTLIAKDKSEREEVISYFMSNEGGNYSREKAEQKATIQFVKDATYDAILGWASGAIGQGIARGGYTATTAMQGKSLSKDTNLLQNILYNKDSSVHVSEDRLDYSSDADFEKALQTRDQALKALNDTRGNKKATLKEGYTLADNLKSSVADAQSNKTDVPNEFKTAKQDLDTALKSINEANTPYQLTKAMESLNDENNSTKKAYKNAIIRLEKAGFTADDVQKTHTAASIFTQSLKGEALDESVLDSIPETDRAVAKEALKRGTNLYTIRNNTASAIVSSTGDAIAIDLDKGTVKDSNGNVSIYDKEGNTHSIDSLESVGSTKFALNSVKLLEDPEAAKAVFKYMESNKDVDPRTLSIDYSKIFNAAKMGISEEEFNKKYGETLKTKNTDVLFKELRDSADLSDSAKIATYAKKGKGNVTFKDNDKEAKRVFSELSKGEREFFKAFGKKLGVDFEFFVDSSSATRGEYIPEEGKITINLAKINKVFSIALHEGIGEFLQAHAGDKYNLVATRVIEYYYDKNSLAMTEKVQQYLNLYQNNGQADKSLRTAANEFVNDTLGDIFSTDAGIKDFINWLKSDNETKNVFTKYFKDIANWIKEVRANGQYDHDDVLNFDDAINDAEEIRKMFLESMNEAIANRDALVSDNSNKTKEEIREELNSIGIDFDESTGTIAKSLDFTLYAQYEKMKYKSVDEAMNAVAEMISNNVKGVSKAKALQWIKAQESLAASILSDESMFMYSQMEYDENYKAIKDDSDYPQGTADFSNLCRKRELFTKLFSNLQYKYPSHLFSAADIAEIRNIMTESELEVACALCYVEDRRQKTGEIAQSFIEEYTQALKSKDKQIYWTNSKGNRKELSNKTVADKFKISNDGIFKATDSYIPNQYDLTTYEGFRDLRVNHKEVAAAFTAFNNARGMSSARLIEGHAEYKREILKYSKAQVKKINDAGGLRIFSFSDFEAIHLIDLVQVITDCAAKGVKIQAYTKVPAFAKLIENTGIKLNRSLIPATSKSENAYARIQDADGNYSFVKVKADDRGIAEVKGKEYLAFDIVEGVDVTDKNFMDDPSNPNIGNIVIAVNDHQARLAMADPFIDYIIGFHSNQAHATLEAKGIDFWTNYKKVTYEDGKTYYQEDTELAGHRSDQKSKINIYTDVLDKYNIKNKEQFVKKFLKECKENNLEPRFSQFLDKDANGNYIYTEGYHKFLIDFKLFDQDGKILPQKKVVPAFEVDLMNEILLDGIEREKKLSFDDNIIKEIEKRVINAPKRQSLDPSEYEAKAKEHFGVTDDFRVAGYLLTDGTMLDFSGAHWLEGYDDKYIADWKKKNDIRQVDHEDIYEVLERTGDNRKQFMEMGEIRLVPEASGINLSTKVEPTAAQYRMIKEYVRTIKSDPHYDNIFRVDLEGDKPSPDKNIYEGANLNEDKIVNDLKTFYSTGSMPKQSDINRFRSSLDIDSEGNKLTNSQVLFFEKSKVRDDQGRLLKVYHGSNLFGFDIFKVLSPREYGAHFGTKEAAARFSDKIYEGYLNIKNPIRLPDLFGDVTTLSDYVNTINGNTSNLINGKLVNGVTRKPIDIINAKEELPINKSFNKYSKAALDWAYEDGSEEGAITVAKLANAYIRSLGYDGVIYNNMFEDKGSDSYLILESNQFKRSDNVNPSNNISMRLSLDTDFAPVFYSKMNQEIESIKQDKIGAASVISYLKGKGVKDEEIKWSGIETFLEGKKSVTKQELLDFAKANEFVLEEKTLGLPSADLYYQFEQKLDELGITGFWMDSYIGMDDEFEPDGMLEDLYDLVEEEEVTQEQYDAFEEFYNQKADQYGDSEKTKWDSYTLDGTTNYREILFKMPDSDYSNEAMQGHWNDTGVLAHARIDDLTLPDGSKTLFVEEIQSDWHNATTKNINNYVIRDNDTHEKLFEGDFNESVDWFYKNYPNETKNYSKPENLNDFNRLFWQEGVSIESIGKVPDAPYKNTYTDYVMKRLLRVAVEGGYDYIGWTTGKMQEERWSDEYAEGYRIEYDQDIPKFMNKYGKQWKTGVSDIPIGSYEEYVIAHDGNNWAIFSEHNDDDGYWTEMLDSFKGSIDLTSEEVRAKFAERNRKMDLYDEPEQDKLIHAVKITPEMKDSVLYKGQARFSLEILGDASPYASVYKQVDISKKVMSRVNNAVISGKKLTKKSMDDLKYGLIGKYNLTFDNAFVNELTEDLNEFDAYMRSGKVDYDVIMEYALQIADKIREKSHYFAGGTDLDNDLIIALNIISSYYEQIDAQNKAAKKTEKLDYAEAKKLTEAASELKDNSNEVVKELESDFSQKVAAEEEKINEQIKNGSQKYKGYSKAEINKLANQKVREKLNSQKESETKAKAKDSVIRTSTRLINWMAHPTDQKHVPEFLKPALTEVIDSIDFVPASLKKDLNAPTDAARTWATSMRRLNDVIAQINSVGSNNSDIDDYQVSQMYNLSLVMEADNLFNDMDKFLKEHVGTKNVSNLDAASMKELAKYMASISKAIDRMNSTYANRKYETIDAWGEEAISQMKAMKPVFDKSRFPAADVFHEFLNLEMLEPISFFEEMGEASSSVMDSFFQGEKKGILIIREAEEFFDKLHEDLGLTTSETGKWSDELHEFEVEGVKLTLSTADIMGLLATYKEEEYVKANDPDNATYHIEAGGIVASKKKVGIKTYNYNPTVVHPVYQQLNEMFSKLTDTQKEYVDRVVEYMSTTLASHGNKTSQNMYGYDKFTGKYYYPLKTDKTAIMTNESNSETNQTALRALVNPSFTKTRINRADNALVVMDFFDVVTEHISGMANYCAYAEVVSDTLRWYNYAPTTRIPNGSSWIRDTYGIKNAMRRVKGVKATSYLETFIRDVNLENKVKGNVFQDKLIGMAKAQAVTGNMRVVVQQPCAITRALDVIEQKYLNAGMAQVTKNPVKITKYAQEKSYLCYWKSKGFSDYRVAQGMKEIIVGNNSKFKDVVEATGMLAGAADDVTWAAMYLASEAKIKATRSDLKVGSSEFDAAVEELFSDIINHTQVIDSTLRKTETNRSKNGLVKLANAFMNEPQKTYNMLHRKINAYYQQGKSEVALKALRKMVAIYCYSAFVTAVAQSVADAFRDDDDETWFYKFLEALLPLEAVNSIKDAYEKEKNKKADDEKKYLTVWTFIGCYGQMGNFFDQLNPVNLIPFFAEASNIAKGYKSQRMDTQIFTQIASTMSTLEKGSTPYGTIYSIAQTVSYATGAPFAATLREVKVLYNNTIGALTGKKWYGSKSQKEKVEKSKTTKATEQVFNSNDLAATKAFIQSEYDAKIADGKDESDAWSAVRTTLKEQYLRELSEGKDKASLKNKYTTLLKETKVKKNGSYVGLDSDQAYKSYIAKWNESLEEEN